MKKEDVKITAKAELNQNNIYNILITQVVLQLIQLRGFFLWDWYRKGKVDDVRYQTTIHI